MTITISKITPIKVARYLEIALKQKERALTKFATEYGPEHSIVQELSQELSTLRTVINEIQNPTLPGTEVELIKNKK